VGLRDVLLGKKKLAGPARERLFALTTAAVTMQTELGLRTAGAAGICFKPLSAGEFVRAENDLQQLLDSAAAESGSKLERREDKFGYTWIVVRDAQLEDQVTTIHAVGQGLEEQGFGGQLLAAVFKFEGGKNPVYWIYGFKRGAFWPFVPTGEDQERDNAEELELKAKLEPELPVEEDLSRWFGVFDAPLCGGADRARPGTALLNSGSDPGCYRSASICPQPILGDRSGSDPGCQRSVSIRPQAPKMVQIAGFAPF